MNIKKFLMGLFVVIALAASQAVAQTGITWDGETNTTFATGTNWVGNVAPVNSSTSNSTTNYAIFSGTPTANQPNVNATRSIAGLEFQTAGWAMTGSSILTVGAFGIDSSGTGTNTISGPIAVGVAGGTWTIGSGNTLDLSGVLSGSASLGAFNVNGGGTLTLSGSSANTSQGAITFSDGSDLNLNKSGVVALAGQVITLGNGSTVSMQSSGQTSGTTQFVVQQGAVVDTLGNNATFAFSGNEKVTLSGGTIQTGAGIWTFAGNNASAALVNGNTVSTITGNVHFGGQNRQVQVFNNASGLDFNWAANIVNGVDLTFNGGSSGAEASLGGNNAFTGDLDITGNMTVYLDHANAAGAAGVAVQNDIAAGSTLAVRGGINYAETGTTRIQYSKTAGFRSVSGNNTWNGAITNPGGSPLLAGYIQVDADVLLMNGSLSAFSSNSRSLAKSGDGALIYNNAANDIANTIYVEGGVFAFSPSGEVNVRGGNTSLNGGTIASPDNIIMALGTGGNQIRFGNAGGGFAAYGADMQVDVGSISTLVWGGSSTALLPTLAISGGAVTGFSSGGGLLQYGGAGYTGSETVSITGGNGTGATASITVVNGQITQVNITNGGSGYATAPTLSVAAPTADGGTANFLANNAPLILNSTISEHKVTLVDNLDLAASGATFTGQREIRVVDNPNSANDRGAISGIISSSKSGVGINKTGAGLLELSNTNTYTGATSISAGTLLISGTGSINNTSGITVASGSTFRYNSTTALTQGITNNGTVAGSGNFGTLTLGGSGSIDPGNSPGIMTAGATDPTGGLDYNFEFTATGAPTYSNASASVNDVLRLTGATPFTADLGASNAINIYLAVATLGSGDTFQGGFFTDRDLTFITQVSGATFNYFVLGDGNGLVSYNGDSYYTLAQYDSNLLFNVSTVAVPTANFSGGTVDGYIMQFSAGVIPEPSTYAMLVAGMAGLVWLRRKARKS